MTEIRDEKLDFWIETGFNVLFIGRHGIGKSTRIFDAFNRAGLRWQYFSAPTLDPWVDFVGVPKETTDEKGGYIDLILPKKMRDDEIEAIFIDELNRAHPKVQNAVLELVQFRSINGRKFKNIKTIWASVNPENEEYKVEKLDPALKDRFHVWCEVPNEPNLDWFVKTYSERLGKGAVAWWNSLSAELKLIITPRRLQYALDMHKANGDMHDVLPPDCNISSLLSLLTNGPVSERLVKFFESDKTKEAKKFLSVENNYAAAVRYLQRPDELGVKTEDWFEFFLPLLADEKISTLVATCPAIRKFVLANPDLGCFHDIINGIVDANQNKQLVSTIKKTLAVDNTLAGKYGKLNNKHPEPPYHSSKENGDWDTRLIACLHMPKGTSHQRTKVYVEIVTNLPKVMTLDQSLNTIELLGILVDQKWGFKIKEMRHFMGVINHCICEISRNSGLGWGKILRTHGSKFKKLLPKIDEASLVHKLLSPTGDIIQELRSENMLQQWGKDLKPQMPVKKKYEEAEIKELFKTLRTL